METTKRVTVKLKNPNPLFEKWITEWRDDANEKDSKMQYCFVKALESLKKYPLPLETGRDCKILKGFGDKLCKMLDDKLIKHKQINNSNEIKKRVSNVKDYVPLYRSGAFAILVTLYKNSLEAPNPGFMLKANIIKEGRHLCDKSFVKPDPGSYYTAWSSMKTLLDKKLVIKQSSPAKFSLSDAGIVLARRLYNTEKNQDQINDSAPNRSNEENLPQTNYTKDAHKKTKNKPSKKLDKLKSNVMSDVNLEKENTSTEVSTSQEETFILPPFSFDVVLLVDTQEVAGSSKNSDDFLIAELTYLKVPHEVSHLNVGDYTWICRQGDSKQELVLPYAIERKRMDDLASSIKDGRFHEQKFRLKQCGIENLIYLIESHGSNSHVGLPLSNLYQAATNTLIQDSFSVKFTTDLKGTVHYLTTLTLVLQKLYKSKTLVSCPKQNLTKTSINDDLVSLMTFTEFNKSAVKSHNFKVQELFIRQLLQLNGMSVEKASAIVEKYPTPKLLYLAYQNGSEANGEMLLSNLQFGNLKKKIGPVISKVIYQLFTSTSYR